MGVISTKDLHKVYSETKIPVKALNGISLSIEEAEFTAIVGPSGSGKTTLLNMLGGLDMPTSGEVHINGTNITSLPSRKLIDFRLAQYRLCFPVIQPDPGSDRQGKCRVHPAIAGSKQKRKAETGH